MHILFKGFDTYIGLKVKNAPYLFKCIIKTDF